MNLFAGSYRRVLDSFIAYHSRSNANLLVVRHESEIHKVAANSDILLDDVLSTTTDVWELFRSLTTQMPESSRLFIAHTNFLWSPLLTLWKQLFKDKRPQRSWFSPSDIDNLLRINGFEIVSRERALLLPMNIPGLYWFFNVLLANLPLFRSLTLVEFYVVRKLPDFRPLNVATIPEKVSLIIPTRDERGNMQECFANMPKLGKSTELVFVDGNSKDGTYEEIERLAKEYGNRFEIKLLRQQKLDGKGSAVREGFEAASGDLLFVFDSDITVRCEDLPKFVLALAEGQAEFVMGSRLVYPMEDEAMRFLNVLGNKTFSALFTWLLNRPIKDTLCGTKGTTRKYYQWIKEGRSYFGDFDPFGDFDLIFGAARCNLKIVEIPIRYRNRTYGEIKISRFAHGWLLLKMTLLAARKMKFRS